MKETKDNWGRIGNFLQVQLPNNQTTMIASEDDLTVKGLIDKSCEKRHLDPSMHFLMLLNEDNNSGLVGKNHTQAFYSLHALLHRVIT